jgi:hypothetical protein
MENDVVEEVKSVFQEIIYEIQSPQTELLKRDPTIRALVDNIVRRVEYQRKPENWPIEDYTDDFMQYHPEDHMLWMWLFTHAAFKSRELADVLCILRGNGCTLKPDDIYGYCIEPIIGSGHGWIDEQQYNITKEPLNDHIQDLLGLLKQLRYEGNKSKIYEQGQFKY